MGDELGNLIKFADEGDFQGMSAQFGRGGDALDKLLDVEQVRREDRVLCICIVETVGRTPMMRGLVESK